MGPQALAPHPIYLIMANSGVKGIMLLSWNIRGMGDKTKRSAIFKYFSRLQPHLICLQETHLRPDSVHLLQSCKYPLQFHSVHSSYSRGVSILISGRVSFECLQQRIDGEGRFVFLLCKLNKFLCIVTAMYVPFSSDSLKKLAQFMAL